MLLILPLKKKSCSEFSSDDKTEVPCPRQGAGGCLEIEPDGPGLSSQDGAPILLLPDMALTQVKTHQPSRASHADSISVLKQSM